MIETLLGILLLAGAVLLAASSFGDLRRQRQERQHLARLASRASGGKDEAEPPPPPAGSMTRHLRAAGLRRVSPLTFAAAAVLLALAVTSALRAAVPELSYGAGIGGLLAAFLLWLSIKFWARRRARAFELKLVDAVSFMLSALRAGENLTQAFASAAEASEGRVQREFQEVAYRLSVGMSVRRALRRMDEGYDSEGTRLFTRTVIAKWQVGGDLVPVLETVNRVIRERLRVRWRLHSQLAGARLAVFMVAVFPYVLIPFFYWQRPDWIARLRDHPLGPRFLFGAIVLQILGVVWMRRIMKIEI